MKSEMIYRQHISNKILLEGYNLRMKYNQSVWSNIVYPTVQDPKQIIQLKYTSKLSGLPPALVRQN